MSVIKRLKANMSVPMKLMVGMAMPNAKMVRSIVSESAQG